MPSNPIKVFLVEDSPVALTILQRVLNSASDIKIVGTAKNGVIALEQIPQSKPDIVCTDLLMGKMDGLELTKQLMATYPIPILVISQVVTNNDTQKIGQLLEAGVLDVFPKPKTGFIQDYEKQQDSLIQKIKVLSGVKVFSKSNKAFVPTELEPQLPIKFECSNDLISNINYKIVTIGVSTGGPKALRSIFRSLPNNFSLPIICIQHISEGFLGSLINWLNIGSALKVKVAENGEFPSPGTVYFAPERYHLELDSQGKFIYLNAPPINNHRPSVNHTFYSIAKFHGKNTIAILLTGMGRDGVLGMEKFYRMGAMTIAQDEATSVIFGMPKEAIDLGVVRQVLPLSEISPALIKLTQDN